MMAVLARDGRLRNLRRRYGLSEGYLIVQNKMLQSGNETHARGACKLASGLDWQEGDESRFGSPVRSQ